MKSNIIKEAFGFLKQNNTAVIATAYRNIPYASTVYYSVDDHFNFYFVVSKSTDKYLNLRQNSNVALVVGTGPKHITVQARGHATGLLGEEREEVLKLMEQMRKENKISTWPLKDIKRLKKRPGFQSEKVFKLTPQHLVFMNLDDQTFPNSLSDDYHQIIPH